MEKEKLSEKLVGMVGENSLTDRTWNEYLDNLVIPDFPTDESKMDDYLKRHANTLKSINGQLNNQIAVQVNEFKKNFKPESASNPNEDDKSKTQQNDKLSDIEKRLSRFEKQEAEKEEAFLRTKKLNEVKELIRKEGGTNDVILNLISWQLNVTNESSVSELAIQGKDLYDKTCSALHTNDSYVPVRGNTFSGGIPQKDKDAYLSHLKETGRLNN